MILMYPALQTLYLESMIRGKAIEDYPPEYAKLNKSLIFDNNGRTNILAQLLQMKVSNLKKKLNGMTTHVVNLHWLILQHWMLHCR